MVAGDGDVVGGAGSVVDLQRRRDIQGRVDRDPTQVVGRGALLDVDLDGVLLSDPELVVPVLERLEAIWSANAGGRDAGRAEVRHGRTVGVVDLVIPRAADVGGAQIDQGKPCGVAVDREIMPLDEGAEIELARDRDGQESAGERMLIVP